jgi:choline dehydrogenase-like flavoprotein
MKATLDIYCRGLKTSQLLELSGIGDRKLLEDLNIPVKVDLPSVGENVQGSLPLLVIFFLSDKHLEHMFSGISWGELEYF